MIPRDFFPYMPDEIFDVWLQPIADDYGWPFKKSNESTKGTKWAGVFGDHNLDFWTSAKWSFRELVFSPELFTDFCQFRLKSIRKGFEEGIPTLWVGVADTKERFRACADFIRANGAIPGSIIVLDRGGFGLDVVDGNHRVAALLHVGIPSGYKIPVWIPIENKK